MIDCNETEYINSAGACDLFIGEVQNIGPLFGLFDSDGSDISLAIEIQQGVFIKLPCLGDFSITERKIKGICFLEIFDLHLDWPVERSPNHFLKEGKLTPEGLPTSKF